MSTRTEKSSIVSRLDDIDIQILQILQTNARISVKELAALVNLSPTPTYERWKRLERDGYIRQYVTVLDLEKVHRGFTVFCSVKLRELDTALVQDFLRIIKDIPEVAECYHISGEYDYLLKIYAPDMKYYKYFIVNVLGRVASIGAIVSTFVMDEVKNTYEVLSTTEE